MSETTKRTRPTSARHQAEQWWLEAAYYTLDQSREVLSALSEARDSLWKSDEKELDTLNDLQTMVARLVIAQCEAIMRHSGWSGGEPDDLPF